MFQKIPPEFLPLLKEVLQKHRPDMLNVINLFPADLTDEQSLTLADAVTDEFCLSGLKYDDEPNDRGLLLEGLIGYLMREPST